MSKKHLEPWLVYMDFNIFNGMIWELVRADNGPGRKLDELLYQQTIPDRIAFLKYIRLEYRQGAVKNMIQQRFENEPVPRFIIEQASSQDGLWPRDLFLLHLDELLEFLNELCIVTIPEKIRTYEREVNDIMQRQQALNKLNLNQGRIGPEEEMLTAKEAAGFLNVEMATLYSYNHKGMLKPFTQGGKLLLYPKSQLVNFLKRKI